MTDEPHQLLLYRLAIVGVLVLPLVVARIAYQHIGFERSIQVGAVLALVAAGAIVYRVMTDRPPRRHLIVGLTALVVVIWIVPVLGSLLFGA